MLFSKIDSKKLFDSHSHISSSEYEKDIDEIVKDAKDSKLGAVIDVSVDLNYAKKSIALSKQKKNFVYTLIGVDPEVFIPGSPLFVGLNQKSSWFEERKNELRKLFEENPEQIIGIGESGIDHYHNQFNYDGDRISKSDLNLSSEMQRKLFEMHLELAQELNLPMSIHSRKAEKLCVDIVSGFNVRGIFHSFTGNFEEAKAVLDIGWGLGINGIITFKNASDLRDLYKRLLGNINPDTPIEFFYEKGFYFETDSPYLSPEGKRGERNVPANVNIVYDTFRKILSTP